MFAYFWFYYPTAANMCSVSIVMISASFGILAFFILIYPEFNVLGLICTTSSGCSSNYPIIFLLQFSILSMIKYGASSTTSLSGIIFTPIFSFSVLLLSPYFQLLKYLYFSSIEYILALVYINPKSLLSSFGFQLIGPTYTPANPSKAKPYKYLPSTSKFTNILLLKSSDPLFCKYANFVRNSNALLLYFSFFFII